MGHSLAEQINIFDGRGTQLFEMNALLLLQLSLSASWLCSLSHSLSSFLYNVPLPLEKEALLPSLVCLASLSVFQSSKALQHHCFFQFCIKDWSLPFVLLTNIIKPKLCLVKAFLLGLTMSSINDGTRHFKAHRVTGMDLWILFSL